MEAENFGLQFPGYELRYFSMIHPTNRTPVFAPSWHSGRMVAYSSVTM